MARILNLGTWARLSNIRLPAGRKPSLQTRNMRPKGTVRAIVREPAPTTW